MFDVFTPQNIAIAAAVSVPVIFGLRHVFARSALNQAREDIAPTIAAYKADTPFTGLTPQQHKNAALLGSLATRAENMSSSFKKQAETLSISKLGPRDPKREIMVAGIAVGAVMANIASNKLSSLLDIAIQNHIAKEAGKPVKEIALSQLSKDIIHVFDETGVTAAAVALEHALEQHVSHQTMETINHLVSDLLTPGLLAAGISAHKEITMLLNGQVTFEELLKDGVVPAAGRFAMVFGGVKVDLATGGATMGLGTVGGVVAGLFFYDEMVKRNLAKEKAALVPYVHKIDTRRDQATSRVNQAIDAEYVVIRKLIESPPKLAEDKALQALLRDAASRFSTDTVSATHHAGVAYSKMVADLPKSNWVDKLLGIDRNLEMTNMCTAARNDKIKGYRDASASFASAMNGGPQYASSALRHAGYLPGGKTIAFVDRLQSALLPIAQAHDAQLQAWGNLCNSVWLKGRDTIVATNDAENTALKELVLSLKASMQPIQRRIAANYQRLGLKPTENNGQYMPT